MSPASLTRSPTLQGHRTRRPAAPVPRRARRRVRALAAPGAGPCAWSPPSPKGTVPLCCGDGEAGAWGLGRGGLDGRARVVADVLGRDRPRADGGVHAGGVRRRDHALRHRERVRDGRGGDTRGARSSRTTRATRTCWRRRSTSRWGRATAGSRASRSSSRSTARWSGCRPTTSTSTSATATTTRVPLQETMGALSEVVEAGKARHIGFSRVAGGPDPGGAATCPA